MNTWTLSRLINAREFTASERIVLEYFFTNIDKNVYCARDTLPSQVWAFLVWQYSRSHLSLRDRFLKIFEDQKKAFDKWLIWEDEYVSIEELAKTIATKNDVKLQYFYDRAASFLEKWWVQYWHNSLKDSDQVRLVVEWVSQAFTKIIEAPFPALGAFQETSTRYMEFNRESLLFPDEIINSVYKDEIIKLNEKLFDIYEKALVIVRKVLMDNKIFNRDEFKTEWAYNSTVNTKAFDICRYLLPSTTATKLGCTFQTRTLESHLTWMLSHPLAESRQIAQAIYNEAVQITPWLLKHVAKNDFEIERTKDLLDYVDWMFAQEELPEISKGISDNERVQLIFDWNLDDNILASILFESSRKYGKSFTECLKIVEQMNLPQKEELMAKAISKRGKFDRMPRALQHSSVMVEFLLDFWAYRDIQRQRATNQIWQWVTSIHGYDYPEYIDLPWMEEFKIMYDEVMTEVTELWRKVIKENPFLVEYVAALWHLVRTTNEMDPGQLAYVIELRTTPHAHHSYRNLELKLFELIQEEAPIFTKYIRAWERDMVTSRKGEAEKTEAAKI